MCTVSVKIDETVLRDMMPELECIAAIRLWVQNLVDLHVQELVAEEKMRALAQPMLKNQYGQYLLKVIEELKGEVDKSDIK